MPKRTDLSSILLIGSGPIVIGQGAEFDYSGTQAARALREEGYRVVLVNSNPATIMTDPEVADRTYIEPITPEWVEKIIARERPEALLPTMGGQTALNVAMALTRSCVLARYGVELIGANERAIRIAEDRSEFALAMRRIGLATPPGVTVQSVAEGLEAVTIRRVALEFGVTPMALYWHVQNKDELLAAMGRSFFDGIGPRYDRTGRWDDQVSANAVPPTPCCDPNGVANVTDACRTSAI